jgi:selenocysteine-specific elongation factor
MIIGTAGHIDHGKSSLIEALTGVRMDRLKEERQRGITIDLNFAPLSLDDGRIGGVVDVPGHEDFVRTMVAGASGIDLVLLVIAADEGIMPQTREHLAITEQLGVARGIPVISKIDLVDAEWLDLLNVEIAEWLRPSPIAFAPPIPVSVVSRQGIPELRQAIQQVAGSVRPRNAEDLFRLPVDRAFSVAGIGTVVTGTAWSGSIAVGDQIRLMPGGITARVRSIEMHGAPVERSLPGARVALGLVGIDRDQIRRGDVVTADGDPWESTLALDVELHLLADAPRALGTRARVRLHLGTAEVIARVYPRARIDPGGTGLARLALEAPTVARTGDRFVLRGYSPVVTVGGGRVLDPLPPRRRAEWPGTLTADDPVARLEALFSRRQDGISNHQLPLLAGVPALAARAMAESGLGVERVNDHWLPTRTIAELATRLTDTLAAFHRARPADGGVPLGELRQSMRRAQWITDAALAGLERNKTIMVADGIARLAHFTPRAPGGDAQVNRVVAAIEKADLAPPTAAELAQALDVSDIGATLRVAAKEGRIEAVERDRYYGKPALERFTSALREAGQAGLITPAEMRDRLGITRKYLIPLLEWADAKGLTVRSEDGRRLRSTR